MALLEVPFSRQPLACVWLVKYFCSGPEPQKLLQEILLEHRSGEVRESFATLLKTAINVTAMNEQSYFFDEDEYLEFDSIPGKLAGGEEATVVTRVKRAYRSAVARFMQFFVGESMLDLAVRNNWRNYDEYFDVVREFV